MNTKAYTLVEVIAVIVILSLLILVAVPSVSKVIRDSKNKAYINQIKEIESATKAWGILNADNIPSEENETIIISLLQLKLANLIAFDLKNPMTGDLFADDMQISITKKGMNLFYEVLEESGTTNEILNPNAPQLILNGGINQSIEIRETYNELGAVAKTGNDILLPVSIVIKDKNDVIVNSVNTNSLNKYTIIYSTTNNGLTSSIKRVVSIVDTIKPIITITGFTNNQYIELEATSNYTLPVASVSDNSGEILNYNILGNFSSVIPGNKKITYEVIDSSKNKNTFVLNYIIKDTINPIITSAIITSNVNIGKKIVTIVASDSGVGLHEYPYSYDNGATWKKENTSIVDNNFNSNVFVRDKVGNQTSILPTVQ